MDNEEKDFAEQAINESIEESQGLKASSDALDKENKKIEPAIEPKDSRPRTKILRQANINAKIPYHPEDEDGAELFNKIRESQNEINKYDLVIDQLKAEQKPHKEALTEANQAIAIGKDALVACTLHICHEENTVRIQRNDTMEWLQERNITDDDRQCESDDVEVEY